jgi:hypothetical protein
MESLLMTDEEVVQTMRAYFEGRFPKVCSRCGRRYENVRDYIENTTPTGPTISYDIELGDWKPAQPIGALAAANCACGTTIALSTADLPLAQVHAVMEWLKEEAARRGVPPRGLLDWVRAEIRRQVLAEPGDRGTSA